MNTQRLLKLASFLDTVKNENFNIRYIARRNECGTVCCALGWAGLIPDFIYEGFKTIFYDDSYGYGHGEGDIRYKDSYHHRSAAMSFFKLSLEQTIGLFEENSYDCFYKDVTPRMVADKIRAMVANHESLQIP